MDKELNDHLAKIESHLAHLEHQFEQINQVVIEQSKEIARLKAAQGKIAASIEATEAERIRATNAKPPHYGTM